MIINVRSRLHRELAKTTRQVPRLDPGGAILVGEIANPLALDVGGDAVDAGEDGIKDTPQNVGISRVWKHY